MYKNNELATIRDLEKPKDRIDRDIQKACSILETRLLEIEIRVEKLLKYVKEIGLSP